MKNNKWCVYKHTSPSGGIYIGITKQNPIVRWNNGFGYRVGADIRNQNFGYIKKSSNYNTFLYALENAEKSYLLLLNEGWTPQQARSVLPF